MAPCLGTMAVGGIGDDNLCRIAGPIGGFVLFYDIEGIVDRPNFPAVQYIAITLIHLFRA